MMGDEGPDKLEKMASRNVREHRPDRYGHVQARQRIFDMIRRAGFRAEQSTQDRFGVGKDQRGLLYNPDTGLPEHELGHALLTPPGESLREHQQRLAQVWGYRRSTMPEEDRHAEEAAAYAVQPALQRRAGVSPTLTAGLRPGRESTEGIIARPSASASDLA